MTRGGGASLRPLLFPRDMTKTRMSRWKAAGLHLGISSLLGTAVLALMLTTWYPSPFFSAMGGNDLVLTLLGVDLVLGPLITLVVFGPAKPLRLIRLDLAIIGVLQASAFAYGMSVIAAVRPVYMVFTVDRFDLVAANDIKAEELAKATDARFASMPWGRPSTIAVATPKDSKEQMRIIMSAVGGGGDLQTFPQYYVPYEQLAGEALRKSLPIATLRKRHPDERAAIDAALARLGRRDEDLRFLPLKARKTDYCVLLDAKSGAVAGFLELYPW